MKKKEISVIMGVYNITREEELYHAVNSILNQTFQQLELIICDDGSDVATKKLLGEIGKTDDRIIVIYNDENKGLASALNQCIQRAQGKYIARMDADDISKLDRLQKQYDFLEENTQYDWVGGNAEVFDCNGIWTVRCMKNIPDRNDFLSYSPYIHPSVLFRKEVFETYGGYKVSNITRRGEDYELFMRLHSLGCKGYNLADTRIEYREDRCSYDRRKYKYRVDEVRIRIQGFQALGILNAKAFLYVIKPVVVGLIPNYIVYRIRRMSIRGIGGARS